MLDLFRRALSLCQNAATSLQALVRDFRDCRSRATAIHALENEGDEVTAAIFAALHHDAVPPLVFADLKSLASGIDDVLDGIDELATILLLYRVAQPAVYLLYLCR